MARANFKKYTEITNPLVSEQKHLGAPCGTLVENLRTLRVSSDSQARPCGQRKLYCCTYHTHSG